MVEWISCADCGDEVTLLKVASRHDATSTVGKGVFTEAAGKGWVSRPDEVIPN